MNELEAIEIIKKNYEYARGNMFWRDDIQAVDTLEDYIKTSKSIIQKQKRMIEIMAEHLTTDTHGVDWVINYFEDEVELENGETND